MKPDQTKTAIRTAAELVANIEPLLRCEISQAKHHGLSTIKISAARAKEIHLLTVILEKRLKEILASETAAADALDSHLDRIFQL